MIEGGGNPLVLFAIAFVLGALHGLEPGHSKTMIAAFIVAVRGTVRQAVLLGVSAAVSHSIIVWVLAGVALWGGNELIAETAEPYFMAVSGAIVLALAAWMFGRLQGERAAQPTMALAHAHGPDHHHGHGHHHDHGHAHSHDHDPLLAGGDAHARAHAADLRRHLADRKIGTGQTILFGLTGGLIPCAAAITVLLVCLHLDSLWLGFGLVSGFSLGLGVTLVGIGMAAAWGSAFITGRSALFDRWAGRLPYLSSLLIGLVGLAILAAGLSHFGAH